MVVVKLLRREWAQDESIKARFIAEAAALESVNNANVVQILDHGECPDGLYIVTEFVEGRTLDALVGERTIPAIIGVYIVAEALKGLAAVHSAGIIHRDVKSANIVVGDGGMVKLMDFGFAESSDEFAESYGTVAGTLGYIAPELLTGQQASVSSDIYAAGITLLEVASGARVRDSFTADDPARHAVSLIGGGAIDHLEAAIAELVRAMSNPDPTLRPPDVRTALDAVTAVIETYRPTVNRDVLTRWLSGERQTLPRKLIDLADGPADSFSRDDSTSVGHANSHAERNEDEKRDRDRDGHDKLVDSTIDSDGLPTVNRWSESEAAARQSQSIGDSSALPRVVVDDLNRDVGKGDESNWDKPTSSGPTRQRRKQRSARRRAAIVAMVLMGGLLIFSAIRRAADKLFEPARAVSAALAGEQSQSNVTPIPPGDDESLQKMSNVDEADKPDGVDSSLGAGINATSSTERDVTTGTEPRQSDRGLDGQDGDAEPLSESERLTGNDALASAGLPTSEKALGQADGQVSPELVTPSDLDGLGAFSSGDSLQADSGSAVVITASPWAHVSINGTRIGTTPIDSLIFLRPGQHEFLFSTPGFPDIIRRVDVTNQPTTRVGVSMWSTVARLTLEVSPWAEVLIDGTVRDTIPMTAPLIIPAGAINLTLRHPELGSYSEELKLEADSIYTLRYNLFELIDR